MAKATDRGPGSFLDLYLREITRIPLLSLAEEQRLARRFRDVHDARAGHALVTANLRFVVKVAYEYRSYGLRMADVVQEGNIGLMRAVQKFDPDRKIRLISYAVWWIRAYIQGYIMRSWSLVKVGTTQGQRKLFFSLARARRELDRHSVEHGSDSDGEDEARLARTLQVKAGEVQEMTQRMERRDLSLDSPFGEGRATSHVDLVADSAPFPDELLGAAQEQRETSARIAAALGRLDERERYIVEQRIMAEHPLTQRDLGERLDISPERTRQLERRAREKLRVELLELRASVDRPTGGRPAEVGEPVPAKGRRRGQDPRPGAPGILGWSTAIGSNASGGCRPRGGAREAGAPGSGGIPAPSEGPRLMAP